ncbi:MAG: 4'-phosphopantetheinyl transferase superfamily protein [Candidatus Korobacteraceae bacterium]
MNLYWLEQTEADVPAGNAWLSAAEALHQDSLRFAKRRNDWRLGRWTAKLALASQRSIPLDARELAAIEIRPDPSGAPEAFVADQHAGVAISLSHRAGRAICAIASSEAAIGCDLEGIEPHSAGFFDDYFTPAEQAWIADASEADHPWLMSMVWSAKESALKALRVGLRVSTRSVVVSPIDLPAKGGAFDPLLANHQPNREHWLPLRVESEDSRLFQGWWKRTGQFVYTVVSHPPADAPILLELAAHSYAPPTAT